MSDRFKHKGKVLPITGHEGPDGVADVYLYSSFNIDAL